MMISCDHCSRAIDDLEVEANVTLHEHLDDAPRCERRYRAMVEVWGPDSWTANMSGAA